MGFSRNKTNEISTTQATIELVESIVPENPENYDRLFMSAFIIDATVVLFLAIILLACCMFKKRISARSLVMNQV